MPEIMYGLLFVKAH